MSPSYSSYYCLQSLFSDGRCSAQEIGAVIAGMIALFVLLANVGLATWTLVVGLRSTKKLLSHQSDLARLREIHERQLKEKDHEHDSAMSLQQQQHAERLNALNNSHQKALEEAKGRSAIELEERRRFLDIQTKLLQETIDLQIKRLRDIRRACQQTLRDVVELKDLSPSLERNEMLVRSGAILRKASIILAPADDKIPDLPDPCYAPLTEVRDALVKVILSWSAEKAERSPNSWLHTEMLDAIREMQSAVEIFIPAAQIEEHRVLTSILSFSKTEDAIRVPVASVG